jgi:alpha,alpha-trehalose phosphorylase
VISQQRFPVEPWCVRELGFNRPHLAESESLFALSNGHIGIRGNLDEGDPNGLPGTYLNSFYESRPLPYAEAGYGYPESGQSVVNVTNGKLIRLLVGDEPFDMRYGEILHHERVLDLRRGVLNRTVEWCSPGGHRVRVNSTRLVSLVRRSLVAIKYTVEPLDGPTSLVIQSELVANEAVPHRSNDPRVAAALEEPLAAVAHGAAENRAMLVHRTNSTKLNLAVAMDNHARIKDDAAKYENVAHEDWARYTIATQAEPGQPIELVKFVAYGWSSERSVEALRDQVDAALTQAGRIGWQNVVDEQAGAFDEFWDGADVEIDGADDIQQAVRFAMFHALQASARAERRAIPAKGLTGTGYDGHAFWDTESFVLPLLSATAPKGAADALRWRLSTMDLARERARTLGLDGVTFPWRTIRGQECSAYWPAGTAALHINADVAMAAVRHVWWTGDEAFDRDVALPLLVETARLWASVAYEGPDGLYHIDGVTGPDEYSAVVDDNTYTNLFAARNLAEAAKCAERWQERARDLDVHRDETARWQAIAEHMAAPWNDDLGIHEQDRGSTLRARWDFERSARDNGYPLLLSAPYFELYRKQVIKQADLVLAMHWCTDAFTAEQKARNFAYYEELTVRDSSLSACTQSVLAAEVGHLDLALDYLGEAALMDLHNLEHNSADGLHIASLAGAWLALVAGFGGMRDVRDRLTFRPQLPPGWTGLRFQVRPRGCLIRVHIEPRRVTYLLEGKESLEIDHCTGTSEETLRLEPGDTVERPWQPVEPLTPRPTQPAGREPLARRRGGT